MTSLVTLLALLAWRLTTAGVVWVPCSLQAIDDIVEAWELMEALCICEDA
jgi:hypothetical protein